jgi:hypothetical protein
LSDANLSGADLGGANFSGTDLRRANLGLIKKDFFERLQVAKSEVAGLYESIVRGEVDGSSYTGECACFVGTVANIRKEDFDSMSINLKPDFESPTERWFFAIKKGDTPENSQISKITSEWVEGFARENGIVLQPKMKSEVESFELLDCGQG